MRLLRNLVLFAGILITTGMVIFFLSITNLLLLVPWDTALFRPEIGTWQRTVNDFFEGHTGENATFIVMALISIVPIVRTLFRRWDAALRIIVANLLFFFLGYIILIGTFVITNLIFPGHPPGEIIDTNPFIGHNYTRSIIPLVTLWILYAVWFREIASLAKQGIQRKSKAKNEAHHEARKRLNDDISGENNLVFPQALATKQESSSQ